MTPLAPGGPLRFHERAFLRRLAYLGARHGPTFWVRGSPPWFGALFAVGLPDVRKRVLANLRRIYGKRSLLVEQRDVLGTFKNYAACLAESLGVERDDGARAEIRVAGREHLEAALREGRGAVLVTAHTGPWDVVARFFSREFDASVAVVMQAEADAAARSLHDDVRRRSGVRVLRVGAGPTDGISVLRHLRAGGVAAFQIDRPAPSRRSIPLELFGRPFDVPFGPFRLAALASAPVMAVFAAREGYFRYRVEVTPPVTLAPDSGPERLTEAAESAVDALERFVRAHPTQWFHFAGV